MAGRGGWFGLGLAVGLGLVRLELRCCLESGLEQPEG